MSPVYDCQDEETRAEGIAAAREALAAGQVVVIPTDTVYGVAADAFNPGGVEAIFEAKGRGRDMPPPVLVPNPRTVEGLAMSMPSYVRRLMDRFWPGALTLVVRAQQSLHWDLGDTNGTVGLRMPDDEMALTLMAETGPLAVSSANRTGRAPAATVMEAGFQLGHHVEVYLDDGERGGQEPSTIVDCTTPDPVLLRAGAVSVEALREVFGDVHLVVPEGVVPQEATAEDLADDDVDGRADDDADGRADDDADGRADDGEPSVQVPEQDPYDNPTEPSTSTER